MARAFQDLQIEERRRHGSFGVVLLWMRELIGLAQFALRERVMALWIATEMRWAWRGIRARGWTAVLAISLVALAISANALVFSAADSLVFHRMPLPNAGRLVEIGRSSGRFWDSSMRATAFPEWSRQSDLFSAVAMYRRGTVFLSGDGPAERVAIADVTPELFMVLGVQPRWGRALTADDGASTDAEVVVISEGLARARFGKPELALGGKLGTTDRPLRVVGVLAHTVRFPSGNTHLWRAIDTAELWDAYLSTIACLVPGRTIENTAAIVSQRGEAIDRAAGAPVSSRRELRHVSGAQAADQQRTLFFILLAAAACLLLTACANVASLELAAAVNRGRQHAIQLALGASRGGLVRAVLMEGVWLGGSAFLLALACTYVGANALAGLLPERFSAIALNPIDADARTIGFMALVALFTWFAASLPVVFYATRARFLDLIKIEGRSMSSSRAGSMFRRALTTVEVALAVLLLIGSVLYVRTYSSMLRVEKGFDSYALASINVTVPPQMLGERRAVTQDLLQRIGALPGVVAVTNDSPPPGSDSPSMVNSLEVNGQVVANPDLRIARKAVTANYFRTMRIPLRAGRLLEPTDDRSNVVVDESLAKRLWPNGAIDGTFRPKGFPLSRVVGVVGHIRIQEDGWAGASTERFLYYTVLPPPSPVVGQASTARPPSRFNQPSYGFIPLTVRLDSPRRAPEFFREVRTMTPKFAIKVDMVDDLYATWAEDTLLATRIVGAFGVFAFVVAMAGVYGVMAYLVSGRAREIGIRMTLGADRGSISRLVLGSSMRLVITGALLGAAGAFAASRWVESQLFGVSPSDPSTYVLVTLLVVATAAVATWHPARQAARVDPAVTLRAE
jgi:predicted permease